MRQSDVEFIHDLAESLPALRLMLSEHIEDNFGEVLPHMFLGDVLRWMLSREAEDVQGEIAAVMSILEEAFSAGDARRKELISTGFVENLPRSGEAGAEIRRRLGPNLMGEASRVA